MLSTPTSEALIALDQATKLPRWTDIDKMIDAELSKILSLIMATRDADALNELRGRALALTSFQQQTREASGTLAKLGIKSPL